MTHASQPASARSRPSDPAADLKAARRVLLIEGEAIAALAASLDAEFVRAIDLLAAVTGRIVATGMGKSGHIARKIAATLASTGAPAFYVHPAEASHGDLGMLTKNDAVLALSFSGETTELADLIAFARRFSLPLVAMVGRRPSALTEQADCSLVLPVLIEACPMGLAPTTSTTAMLALGDAIAVALLERRGFTAADFQVLHPGGKLGQQLLRVRDLMHTGADLPLVKPGTSMAEAILVMTEKRFGCCGVVDAKGKLAGIVTDGDLRRHLSPALLSAAVEMVMTRAPRTIRPNALAAEALGFMNAQALTVLFAVEGGRPTGILHVHDCLRAGVR
ncbi:MAG: KpsF/GutQ family sugar-phosphate isomerase [Alphaproteobacteria bacterium]|nr:KpsF/GutQ family sugar-phosphate isomerase [Alphaproteobacteria bacterium]